MILVTMNLRGVFCPMVLLPGCLHGQAASPAVTAVVHGASFTPGPVAPGEIVTLFGSGMGPAEIAGGQILADRLATTISGARVLIDGIAAPILYVSATQSSVIVPYTIDGKLRSPIQAEYEGRRSAAVQVGVARAAPGIFASGGAGQGVFVHADGTLNSASNPAEPGTIVTMYGTGEGQTSPFGIDGLVTGATPAVPVLPLTVTFGTRRALLLYAGAAPGAVAGVFQINATVPRDTAVGHVPVVVRSGEIAASTPVGLSVAVPAGLQVRAVQAQPTFAGNTATVRFELNAPAPANGVYLLVRSGDARVSLSPFVRVEPGEVAATASARVPYMAQETPVEISASLPGSGARTSTLLVRTLPVVPADDPDNDSRPCTNTNACPNKVGPDLVQATAAYSAGWITFKARLKPTGLAVNRSTLSFTVDVDSNPATGFRGIDSGGNDAGVFGPEWAVTFDGSCAAFEPVVEFRRMQPLQRFPMTVPAVGENIEVRMPVPARTSGTPMRFKVTVAPILSPCFRSNSGIHDYLPDVGKPGAVVGETAAAVGPPAQLEPAEGATFDVSPRTTTLRWASVPGAKAYIVHVDFNNGSQWCSELPSCSYYRLAEVNTTSYTFDFVGAQRGRWRVAAVDAEGLVGVASPWRTFTHMR